MPRRRARMLPARRAPATPQATDAPGDATPADSGDGAIDGAPSGDGGDSSVDATTFDTGDSSVDATTSGEAGDGGPIGDGSTSDVSDGASPIDASDGGDAALPLSFSIDVSLGPARQFQPPAQPTPVPATIYGINASGLSGQDQNALARATRFGLVRRGSNAFTAWNWTLDTTNLGSTACYEQGQATWGGALAGAVTQGTDSIAAAQARSAAYVVTVPIVDFVASALTNDTSADCPGAPIGCAPDSGSTAPVTSANVNSWPFASSDAGSAAFLPNAPAKGSAFCACAPGAVCDAGCTVSTSPVYADELVNYVGSSFGTGGTIFFALDNEPNLWGYTHPEVWPSTGSPGCASFAGAVTYYDDIVGRDERFATAVKAAWPAAKVLGPVVVQDGIIYASSYGADPHAPTAFIDYYLQQMSAASADAGQPLIDGIDVHYYTSHNVTAAVQCVQNTRMFWDPGYTAVAASDLDLFDFGWHGLQTGSDPLPEFDTTDWYPRQMIPRLQGKIATAYAGAPAAAPGLVFSEYNGGCETTVEGAVAEADLLGIFGREGVLAAAAMPTAVAQGNYLLAAFDLYRDYDGSGAVVGDTAVRATTTDDDAASVYAFAHAADASKLELVVINKTAGALSVPVTIANAPTNLTTATLYGIVDGAAAVSASPDAGAPAPAVTCAGGSCALDHYDAAHERDDGRAPIGAERRHRLVDFLLVLTACRIKRSPFRAPGTPPSTISWFFSASTRATFRLRIETVSLPY